MQKKLEKMSLQEIKEYYERRALIFGALFAFALLAIAFFGFFLGFKGI